MNTKLLFASLFTAAVVSTASSAHAGRVELGAQGLVLPSGELTVENDDVGGVSGDSAVAYGVGALVDFVATPYISVGFAPRYILGIKGEDFDEDDDGASELDLSIRISGRVPVTPKLDLFAYGAPGYSFIFLPDNAILDEVDDPQGLIVGVGGGVKLRVIDNLALVGDVGYTFGFQGTTILDQDVDAKTDLLHVGVGLQAVL